MEYKTFYSWDSELSADSVEFCPTPGYQELLTIGTYFVSQSEAENFSPSQRKGRIYLLELVGGDDSDSQAEVGDRTGLEVRQSLEVDAVLDMKWSCSTATGGQPLLAVADAKGTVSIYNLTESNTLMLKDQASIKQQDLAPTTKREQEGEDIALSLDWNDRKGPNQNGLKIAVSGSRGNVILFDVIINGDCVKLQRSAFLTKCHDFEAWIVAFAVTDAGEAELVYTGGDDAALKAFDARCCDITSSESRPVLVNRKHHTAGVTSLLCDIRTDYRLFSGSYDDTLATWDTRMFRSPVEQVGMGGGVWRIRQHLTADNNLLAVAAMYNGFHIYDVTTNSSAVHFTGHDSIAYGVDIYPGQLDTLTLVSCSFYDHLVKLWKVSIK